MNKETINALHNQKVTIEYRAFDEVKHKNITKVSTGILTKSASKTMPDYVVFFMGKNDEGFAEYLTLHVDSILNIQAA